jgi:hypothetical protein
MFGEPGWVSVQIGPDRASSVNRALAEAGIFASSISSGNDLEDLFLTLTRSDGSDPDGTFAGTAGPTAMPQVDA